MKLALAPSKTTRNIARDILILALLAVPVMAFAQTGSLDSLTGSGGIGCTIIKWMKGPLAILVFGLVAVVTIVVGMFAKMDWSKILSIVILFGILQGLGTLFGPWISSITGIGSSCL